MSKEDIEDYSLLDVKEKVVLDVGASMGDSAELFLRNGARKVICIELQKCLADKIKLPKTVVINQPFKLDHLTLNYDCMKMDIEGYEALLLPLKRILKPSIIEVHSQYLIDEFEKMGFTMIRKPKSNYESVRCCTMKNF